MGLTYEITSKDNWDVPNMEMIEIGNRVAFMFTLNGVEVTDKKQIIAACDFYSGHCRYVMRRFVSGKQFKSAQKQLKYLTAYAVEQLIQIEKEQLK